MYPDDLPSVYRCLWVSLSVRPCDHHIFRFLCICWQINWKKWTTFWHADASRWLTFSLSTLIGSIVHLVIRPAIWVWVGLTDGSCPHLGISVAITGSTFQFSQTWLICILAGLQKSLVLPNSIYVRYVIVEKNMFLSQWVPCPMLPYPQLQCCYLLLFYWNNL